MRTSWIVIVAAALGCLIGLTLTYRESANVEDLFESSFLDLNPELATKDAVIPARAIVVGESVFDFGTLEKNHTGKCTFTIRNDSVATLVLGLESVSCGLCIQTEFSHAEVPSSEAYQLEVNYTTQKDGPEFSEYIEVKTSDPQRPVLRFNITGYVTKLMRFSKSEINFGSISAGEDVSNDFRIYGFSDEPLQITSHDFSGSQSSEYFRFEVTPLEFAEYRDEAPRAKSAVQAKISMLRGKPLGPVKQTLNVLAEFGDKSTEAELTIRAHIVSDIMLIGGSDFSEERNLVSFRAVDRAVGQSTTLRIRVRGPYRDEVKLSVGEIDPEGMLTATIGEPTVLATGYLYPLKITVPPGAEPVNRLGSQQSKVGVIHIETTHPSAKQVPVYVSFAIE